MPLHDTPGRWIRSVLEWPTLSRTLVPLTLATATLAATVLACTPAHGATPAELLAAYTAQAGSPPQPARGQVLFTTNFGRDLGLSCASCHTAVPLKPGKDQITEKPIAALAPAANPKRFTDRAEVERWFRLNCKDFVGRECTAAEKADVLAWLLTLTP